MLHFLRSRLSFVPCGGSQVLDPDKGTLFIPPHIRILHVAVDTHLMDDSVADNLFFGIRSRKEGRFAKDLKPEALERGFRTADPRNAFWDHGRRGKQWI